MPDDPKAALPAEGDGAADKASEKPAGNSEAGETAEERATRLEKERDEMRQKYDNEHQLRLSHQTTVEAANRIIAEGGAKPPTDDPLEAEIAELSRAKAEFDKANVSDPATNRALREAIQEREERTRAVETQRRIAQAKRDIASVPQEYQTRAWQLWQSGEYWTIAAAHQAAKGERAEELEKKLATRDVDDKKREAEILARQAAAPGSPRGGGGGGGSGKTKMPLSQYVAQVNALHESDPAAARKLTRDKDEGRIELDYSA